MFSLISSFWYLGIQKEEKEKFKGIVVLLLGKIKIFKEKNR